MLMQEMLGAQPGNIVHVETQPDCLLFLHLHLQQKDIGEKGDTKRDSH